MILVVDANMLFAESGLEGPLWTEVQQAVRDGMLRVVVPRIAAAEVTARIQILRRKSLPTPPPRELGAEAQAAYEKLKNSMTTWAGSYDAVKVLTDAGFEVIDTPDVSHDVIAQRAIDRVPPFNTNGGGYRDTLHWFSLLAVAKANPDEEIFLFSADNGYGKNGELHPTLVKEAHAEVRGSDVVLCQSFADFDIPGKYAGQETGAEVTHKEAQRVVDTLFQDGPVQSNDLWLSAGLLHPEDADLSSPSKLQVKDARQRPLAGGGIERHLRIWVRAHVEFDWSDSPDSQSLLELEVRYTLGTEGEIVTADLVASRFVLEVDSGAVQLLRQSLNSTLPQETIDRINRSISEAFPRDLLLRIARLSGPTLPRDQLERINQAASSAIPRNLIDGIVRSVTQETLQELGRAAARASEYQIEQEADGDASANPSDQDSQSE